MKVFMIIALKVLIGVYLTIQRLKSKSVVGFKPIADTNGELAKYEFYVTPVTTYELNDFYFEEE